MVNAENVECNIFVDIREAQIRFTHIRNLLNEILTQDDLNQLNPELDRIQQNFDRAIEWLVNSIEHLL